MNTAEAQLSSELQELYLESKEKLSDILFLEGESRFFQKLFEKALLSTTKEEQFGELKLVSGWMAHLRERIDKLKKMLNAQQLSIQTVLKDADEKIGLSLVDQNCLISSEIKSLLILDRTVKKELYAHVGHVISDQLDKDLFNSR